MTHKLSINAPTRIIFFGTPEFSVPILTELASENNLELFLVTAPPRPSGRTQTLTPTAVSIEGAKLHLSILEPENPAADEFIEKIKELKPDLFVVAAYGKILSPVLLAIPKYGALNIHPSLLPKLRGPSPIEGAILAGLDETGVTIILMDALMDHGPIVAHEKIKILPSETRLSLSPRLADISSRLLMKTLPQWVAGKITPTDQQHDSATFTKILTRDDGRILWTRPAVELERQVRAYLGWPDSFFMWQRNSLMLRCKVESAHIILGPIAEKPIGAVWQGPDAPIAVQTIDGSLSIDRLWLEGKTSAPSAEFVNGYPDIIGAMLL